MHYLSLVLFLFTSMQATPTQSLEEVCLSSEEAKLYKLINEYRDEKNLPPIGYSAKLSKVAQQHVRDLEENYDIGKSDKCNPHSWSKKGDWSACCYTSDHKKAQCMWDKPKEISGYASPGYEIAYYSSAGATAEEGLRGWKKSPSHNPLLINKGIWKDINWEGVGIGIYGQYGVVWFGELSDTENVVNICE